LDKILNEKGQFENEITEHNNAIKAAEKRKKTKNFQKKKTNSKKLAALEQQNLKLVQEIEVTKTENQKIERDIRQVQK